MRHFRWGPHRGAGNRTTPSRLRAGGARPSPGADGHEIETTLPTGHRYRSRPPPAVAVATIGRTPIRHDYLAAG